VSRIEPRLAALEALYAADAVRAGEPDLTGLSKRARDLAAGAWELREQLDAELDEAARGWRVERMPIVDRNVLRLALYELRHTDTPVGVVISEAVELVKVHSTERSGAFVNGVLGSLAEDE
jgi:N utilization substance protein B